MDRAVTLPPGIGLEADDKKVKFRLPTCEGIGTLDIWPSPTKPGRFIVVIEVTELMAPEPKPEWRIHRIEPTAKHVPNLRKAAAGLDYEYELIVPDEAG